MNALDDAAFAKQFAIKCGEARAALERHMAEHRLRPEDGWTIYEFTRQIEGRSELVLRPMHPELVAPSEFECACMIDEPGTNITSGCRG